MRQVEATCTSCGLKCMGYVQNSLYVQGVMVTAICHHCGAMFAYPLKPEKESYGRRFWRWFDRVTYHYLPAKIYSVVVVILLPTVFYLLVNDVKFPESLVLSIYMAGLCLIPAGAIVVTAMGRRFGCKNSWINNDDDKILEYTTNPAWSHLDYNIWHKHED